MTEEQFNDCKKLRESEQIFISSQPPEPQISTTLSIASTSAM